MALPAILLGESPTRLLQGATGAIATLVIGFYWRGRVTGGSAREMAHNSVSTALVSALAPICVDKFQHSADAASNLMEFKKISSWQRVLSSKRVAGRRCRAASRQMHALRRPCATMLSSLQK
jgi:hypothetical protein